MFDLVRWSPFGTFGTPFQLHREIDELFSRFFSQRQAGSEPSETPTWWPAVESWTADGNVHVRVALPGVDPKDVELSVTDNMLTIKGERRAHQESKEGGYYLREFSHGTFERILALPDGVDPGKVAAKYTNGMLEITMPAPVSVVPKKVEIQIDGKAEPKAVKG
jgi:HSP20 family protein